MSMVLTTKSGKFFNPTFQGPNYSLVVEDDTLILYRKGRVVWETARRSLKGFRGVKLVRTIDDSHYIVDGRLVLCSVFEITAKAPFPEPATGIRVIDDL